MKIIAAAGGIVVNPSNKILLIYRRKKWDLPKGKLDDGETIEQCAIREVEEETGIKALSIKRFITITKHTYFDKYENQEVEKHTHWFEMNINNYQIPTPQTEEDIEEIIWADKNNLDNYLSNSYKNIEEVVALFLSK